MTFCLGMRLDDGLVAIADTRITTGSECITGRKLTAYSGESHAFMMMTSGLRSVRDKAITYFEEAYQEARTPWDRMFKVCNELSTQLRRVADEDRQYLEDNGLRFNTHALVGGQMEKDQEHKLYMVYPEGNWVEVGTGTPYAIIGNSGYGKPILDRALHASDAMQFAFKVGCLSFDSTRISAADVGLPIDVAFLPKNTYCITQRRFDKMDFADVSTDWDGLLRNAIRSLPFERMEAAFQNVPPAKDRIVPIKWATGGQSGGT